jgi:hypothetical protein
MIVNLSIEESKKVAAVMLAYVNSNVVVKSVVRDMCVVILEKTATEEDLVQATTAIVDALFHGIQPSMARRP